MILSFVNTSIMIVFVSEEADDLDCGDSSAMVRAANDSVSICVLSLDCNTFSGDISFTAATTTTATSRAE